MKWQGKHDITWFFLILYKCVDQECCTTMKREYNEREDKAYKWSHVLPILVFDKVAKRRDKWSWENQTFIC